MSFFKRRSPKIYPTHLVVGLGNPGPEYRGTRHNVGFEVVEQLSADHKIDLKDRQHQAQIGLGDLRGVPVALAKPLTYMNLSGRAVAAIARHHNIPAQNILVIADDLDLPTGHVRMRRDGSAGGHNGHKSIIASLRTMAYPRIKIGIGKGADQTVDHVLSRFEPDEKPAIDKAIRLAKDAAELWLTEGLEPAIAYANRLGKRLDE